MQQVAIIVQILNLVKLIRGFFVFNCFKENRTFFKYNKKILRILL